MSHISYIQYKTIKEMEDYKQTLYNDELLNILPDGVIIFDTNGEVIQLNQQAFAELQPKLVQGTSAFLIDRRNEL